uniref:Zinc finger, CCHC-type n=1 Tax=Tanacetum cinerariifolium TaxID=118510 RepID=A0A6L2KXX7_TANCI|nr:zinc finger, CCHC-type [Tanacetum cinerariifolium]
MKVRKVFNAVPDKFVPVVETIEMIVDFKTVKLEGIIRKLKTYEERIKFRKGSQEDNSEKLLFTYRRREISNLVYEDTEPTLLMVTSLEEEPTWNENGIERDEIPKEKLEGIRSEIEIDLKSKLELWKLGILQEIKMEKQEFEKKIINREMAFENQMQRELENLKKLRDYTSKKMKKLKIEREQFERENHKKVDPEDRDTSTKRNRLLEIQDYEMKQMKEDSDKGNKDARDEVKDKEERSQIKEEVQDIVRVKDKNQNLKNKTSYNLPKIKMIELEDIEGMD